MRQMATRSSQTPEQRPPGPASKGSWPFRPLPLHSLLLAGYPILFLFAQNLSEVTLGEVIPPVGRALIGAATVVLVAGLVLRDLRRGALVATAVVVFWFGYGHVGSLLGPLGASRDLQLTAWGVAILVTLLAAVLLRERWIAGLTKTLNIVGGVLLGMTLLEIGRYAMSRPALASAATGTNDAPVRADRDIYFLVWDRYGSPDAVDLLGAGQDDLEAWLGSRGFSVATAAHANYGRTALSLAATLNLTPLDDVAARMGPMSNDLSPINDLLQSHAVGRLLKAQGYRYIHIGSWFAPTRTIRIADENHVMPNGTDFEAKLGETTFEPTLDDLLDDPAPPAHHVLHRTTALWQFREFDQIRSQPGPKFVMLHVLLPHEPYVFDDIGDYPSDTERAARGEGENYRQQTIFVNDQLKRMVDGLLDRPADRQPIIVIVGDEGPFPARYAANQIGFDWTSATTSELATKYGILNAFYLPGDNPQGAPGPYQTMSSWNTFRVVLARYLGADLPLLPDRSYTSKGWNLPYDLTDITDRLPAPYGKAATPPII